ncbi:MAG TPA: hypothetical protein VF533_23715 [Solirubrobacteraceae bacterium]|jgi:hypothetical protein
MLHAALVTFASVAEEGAEPSKTPFYIAGGALALFAVLVSALGITQHDFPRTKGASRAVMALAALLVAAAMATAVISS